MPNWCLNELTVSADDEKEIEAFLEFTTGKTEEGEPAYMDFNKIKPMPDEIRNTTSPCNSREWALDAWREKDWFEALTSEEKEERLAGYPPQAEIDAMIEKHGASNWYDWSTANWGVKWPASSVQAEISSMEVQFEFDTPWGPPENIFEIISEKFPDLYIDWHYREPNMRLSGYL